MPPDGRDFPAKVCPTAFSKCRRPRFSRKSVPDGIFKVPTAAKRQQYRARWTGILPSIGRGNLFLRRRRGILCDRARWIYKMASTGRDFPGKVCPMAFSKCRRPRKDSNIAPGGQGFCLPPGAITYHQLRFILMAPSQWNWKCTASEECEMTLSGKYKCPASEEEDAPPPPP